MTAATLAEELEVSERTIYRDVRDLGLSGVPILGEPGVGYALRRGFDLPPMQFTVDEIEALVLGCRVVSGWADEALDEAARSALCKIEAALPADLRVQLTGTTLYSPNFRAAEMPTPALGALRIAIRERRKVRFAYTRRDGEPSARLVRPLGLAFVAPVWLMTAWCELRDEFRNFRVDRIGAFEVTEEMFEPEPGRTMEDYLATVR